MFTYQIRAILAIFDDSSAMFDQVSIHILMTSPDLSCFAPISVFSSHELCGASGTDTFCGHSGTLGVFWKIIRGRTVLNPAPSTSCHVLGM